MARPTLTLEQRAEEITLYTSGKVCSEIAAMTGRNEAGIRHRMRKAGVLRNPKEAGALARSQGKTIKATPEKALQAKALIEQGLLGAEVCQRLGVSICTLVKLRKIAPPQRTKKRIESKADTRIPYEVFKKMRDQENNQSGVSQ